MIHARSRGRALIKMLRSSIAMEVSGFPAHHDAPPDPGECAGRVLRQEGKTQLYRSVELLGSGSVVTSGVSQPRVYTEGFSLFV